MGPEKIFLAIAYLDMQGTKPDWRDSKAYIEYDIKDDNITIHDENKMFLAQASTEIVKDPYGDNQGLEFLDITFSLMFTKPMETSHVAIQVVDHIRNYELVYFKDALKVVDRPISEMPEFPGKIEKANTKPKQDEDIHFVLAVNGTEDTIFAAVDGDADRCVFIDNKAKAVSAEKIGIITSRSLIKPGANKVLAGVPCSMILEDEIPKIGGELIWIRVGDVFVCEELKKHNAAIAMEISAHFFAPGLTEFIFDTLPGTRYCTLPVLPTTTRVPYRY